MRRGASVPSRELTRYECEQKRDVTQDDSVEKCMASHAECWKTKA